MNVNNTDPVDPNDHRTGFSPAQVTLRDPEDGSTNTVCYADVRERDSGSFRLKRWRGRRVRIPAWRVCGVRYLATESFDQDGPDRRRAPDTIRRQRVADCDWHGLPADVQEREHLPDDDEQDVEEVAEVIR